MSIRKISCNWGFQIQALSSKELAAFRSSYVELYAAECDRQIRIDSATCKLALSQSAIEEYKAGKI